MISDIRIFHLLVYGILLWLLSACTVMENEKALTSEMLTIERYSSDLGKIAHVSVSQTEHGHVVRGQVKPVLSYRGIVPGHVDIELKNSEAETIYKGVIDYTRRNAKSRTAYFSVKLDEPVAAGSLLRVIHHVPNQGGACHRLKSDTD